MMGFPCLRFDGDFFACCDRKTGDLVVKLTEDRVTELVTAGQAGSFAPGGRPFREWARVTTRDRRRWRALLDEALHCSVDRQADPGKAPKKKAVRGRRSE
jgi:hypothetical protein